MAIGTRADPHVASNGMAPCPIQRLVLGGHGVLRRRAPELPITIMSGYTANDIPIEFAQDTHARFLAKPFRAQALTDTLRELLN